MAIFHTHNYGAPIQRRPIFQILFCTSFALATLSEHDAKKMNEINILRFEAFQETDLPELEDMIFSLYEKDPCGENMSVEKIRKSIRELAALPEKGSIIMFRMDQTIVGYAIIIYYWSNEHGGDIAFIDEICIKADWRRQGIGSSFVKHIAAIKTRPLKGIQLKVQPENVDALKFYESLDFLPLTNRSMFKKIKLPKTDFKVWIKPVDLQQEMSLIKAWAHAPHVRKWWSDPEKAVL